MSDFWDDIKQYSGPESSLDIYLQGKTASQQTSLRDLTDKARKESALELPQVAGVRVRFAANLGALLTYDDAPAPDAEGTVILVKTAMGKSTSYEDRVFVLWDDGKFRAIQAEHLRRASTRSKQAQSFRMVVSDLGDLSGFFSASSQPDELVHTSTKDLWSFQKAGDKFVIERLFNDNGKPLKV